MIIKILLTVLCTLILFIRLRILANINSASLLLH